MSIIFCFFFFSLYSTSVKKKLCKLIILILFVGINIPFKSLFLGDLNSASSYSYLCKSDYNSDSEEKKNTIKNNCFFCILNKDNICDDIDNLSENLDQRTLVLKDLYSLNSFSDFSKIKLTNTRSPPFIS